MEWRTAVDGTRSHSLSSFVQEHDGTCRLKSLPAVGGITGYERLPPNDYSALMHAVATIGPIAISVDASWDLYEEVPLRPKVRT